MDNAWADCLDLIKPYTFNIFTNKSSATGFLLTTVQEENVIVVATALHVVEDVIDTDEQIVLVDEHKGITLEVDSDNWSIETMPIADLAIILVKDMDFSHLPQNNLTLFNPEAHVRAGVQIGWCGYPALAEDNLCFFTGYTSAWFSTEKIYYVDGVSVHGLSGAPVFIVGHDGPVIIGVNTGYRPNPVDEDIPLGLCSVGGVGHYQKILQKLSN